MRSNILKITKLNVGNHLIPHDYVSFFYVRLLRTFFKDWNLSLQIDWKKKNPTKSRIKNIPFSIQIM